MANSVDPDQTAPLLASFLNLSVMLGNYLQQTTSADHIFRCNFFLGALRVKACIYLSSNVTAIVCGIPDLFQILFR